MGQRGPKPTPTKILAMRGSWHAKTRHHEPHAPAEKPPCPTWLSVDAKKVWRTLIPQLHQLGVLAKVDGWMLARYCVLWGEWREAASWLRTHGQTYEGEKKPELWPQVRLLLALSAELRRIEQHFGMSPSARASLGQVPQRQPADGPTRPHGKDPERFFRRRD